MTLLGTSAPNSAERDGLLARRGKPWLLLVAVVLGTLLAGYLAVAALFATIMVTARGADFSLVTVLAVSLPGWLGAHQVPLSIQGAPLSVLPSTLTLLVGCLTAVASSGLAGRLELRTPAQAMWVVLGMGLPHALAGGVIATLLGGPATADPVIAAAYCGLVAAVASLCGTARRCGLLALLEDALDERHWRGLRLGVLAAGACLALGVVTVVVALALAIPEFPVAPSHAVSIGDWFGTGLLSVLYTPEAALAGWAFLTGSGLSIGSVVVQPWSMTPGALPALPLFTLLPVTGPAWWWSAVCAIPPVVGLLVGWRNREVSPHRGQRLLLTCVPSVVCAATVSAFALVAGGSLGGGSFDPVSLRPLWLLAATTGWVLLGAAPLVLFAGPRPATPPESAPGGAGRAVAPEAVDPDTVEVPAWPSADQDEAESEEAESEVSAEDQPETDEPVPEPPVEEVPEPETESVEVNEGDQVK